MKTQGHKPQAGQTVLISLVVFAILLTLSAVLMRYMVVFVKAERQTVARAQALQLAEAGVDEAVSQLNQNSNYGGESNTALGNGMFTVSVTTINSQTKSITATGYVPNSQSPTAKRTVKVNVAIDTSVVAFNFGVQVGAGGLSMSNGSKINGNVFSNGNITGGSGNITGDATVAAGTQPTADQQWILQNMDFSFGNAAATEDVAENFVSGVSKVLNEADVYIRKIGNPGDLTVRILTDNAGVPSKTVLASTNITANLVTASYGWIQAVFATPPALTAGTTYWLEISPPAINANNYYIWGGSSNSGSGNGYGMFTNNWNAHNPAWSLVNGNFDFQTFMGGVTTYFDGGINVGGNLRATEIRDCGTVTNTAFYDTVFTNCSASTSVGSIAALAPAAMPISNAQIADWENTAQSGSTIIGPHTVNGQETMGPAVITGDLTVNNGAILVLTGPVWVMGNINISNNAIVKIDASLGNTGTVLLADNQADQLGSGIINISNNAQINGNGNQNSYPLVVTTNSSDSAMTISNNSSGAIYYASQGTVQVSNNARGNQITGYAINLNNNSKVNYQSGLQSATFSNGPGGSWAYVSGTYSILP